MRKRSMVIKVSKDIIQDAVKRDSRHCMIAEALRHMGAYSTRVTAETIAFNREGQRYFCAMPPEAAVKLKKFDDNEEPLEPFEFVLPAKNIFVEPIKIRGPRKKPYKKRIKTTKKPVRRSKRRFHGLAVIEVKAKDEPKEPRRKKSLQAELDM